MNTKAINQVKKELLEKSDIYKRRQELVKDFVDSVEKIIFSHLGEEGKKMISKYEKQIKFVEEIMVPGNIKESYGCYERAERIDVKERKIPNYFDNIGYYWGFFTDENLNLLTESEKTSLEKLRKELEENAKEFCCLVDEIYLAFKDVTLADIKANFPEAFILYNKFK